MSESGLVVNQETCVGCGKCVRACASHGIELVGEKPHRKARVTDGCVMCGMCVGVCPFGSLAIVKSAASDEAEGAEGAAAEGAESGLAAYRDVWVFAQQNGGVVAPVAFELLTKGRELADELGCKLVAVYGEGAEAVAEGADEGTAGKAGAAGSTARDNIDLLAAYGADEVVFCRDDRLADPDCEVYTAWICRLIEERRPEIVLYGATSFGRELAPSIATRIRTGLTADCTVLRIDPETRLLQQTRPTFGGNLMATIVCPDHRPQMATVRPGVLKAAELDPASGTVSNAKPGRVVTRTETHLTSDDVSRVKVIERLPPAGEDSITNAEALVVVGRGIGSQKNLPLMRRLAELLGAKLGCTRPLVESGWLEYKHQVGQTGVSVAPKLLVSIGVSGAIQHLAGIGGAETIVAINSDPDAPIFGVSRYAAVGDCLEIVRALVEELEQGK